MSKNFKKYFSIVLAILMLVSIVPTQLFATSVEDPWVLQSTTNVNNNQFLNALSYLGYDTTRFTKYNEAGGSVDSQYWSDVPYNTHFV